MDLPTVIRSAPKTLELGGDPAATFHLDEDLIAIHGDAPGPAVAVFKGENLTVASADSVSRANEVELGGPVYRGSGGGLAVPTGRVLVRLGPGEDAQAHSAAFSGAGFQLEEALRYAPEAAWVKPLRGGTPEALSGLERLRAIPAVEHVEPQVLTEAARRPAG